MDVAFLLLVLVTVTAAFNAAGAILVISFMITSPVSAYLLSQEPAHEDCSDGNYRYRGSSCRICGSLCPQCGNEGCYVRISRYLFIAALGVERVLRRRRQRRLPVSVELRA